MTPVQEREGVAGTRILEAESWTDAAFKAKGLTVEKHETGDE